jgi:non-ribosomal peptide synthetase component F
LWLVGADLEDVVVVLTLHSLLVMLFGTGLVAWFTNGLKIESVVPRRRASFRRNVRGVTAEIIPFRQVQVAVPYDWRPRGVPPEGN